MAVKRTSAGKFCAYGADFGEPILGAVVFAGHDGAGRMRSLTEREQAVLRNAVRQARVM